MKKIKLYQDHTRITGEGKTVYKAGEIIELEDDEAQWLVQAIITGRERMRSQAEEIPGTVEYSAINHDR